MLNLLHKSFKFGDGGLIIASKFISLSIE